MSDRPAPETLLPLLSRLTASMEALAAVAVHLAPEGPAAHPAIAQAVANVARLAGVPDVLPPEERAIGAAFARAFFRQAANLIEHPERAPQWSIDDPALIEAQGRASGLLARILRGLPPETPLFRALDRAGARFLDIGTGVGWLAIGLVQAFPGIEVLGVDREEVVLSRARENVRAAGLQTRITLRHADAAAMDDERKFDVAWLPGPFLDGAAFPAVAARALSLLAPGGIAVVGLYGDDDPLMAALSDLRTLRSGGTVWTQDALAAALTQVGFERVAELPKRWPAPVRLVLAHASGAFS